ncbi:MAG: hypothetical protein JSV33_09640 [bacterium]|nr:MAG: hypothetical protein JSV33_09640 [bacterium]
MKRFIYISVSLTYLVLALMTSGCSDDSTGPKPTDEPKHLWSKRFGDTDEQDATSTACDGLGNVIVTGDFDGTVDFGGGPLTSAGGYDIFLAKLDANGNHLWSKRFGDADYQYSESVACDGSGNVTATGHFRGTVDFGGGPLTSEGDTDIFIVQFDANGNHLWSKRFGGSDRQYGLSVACDGLGNVIVTGYFKGTVDFGGGLLTCAGEPDIFLVKFDNDGGHLWSKRFGDGNGQRCTSVVCDGSGNVIATGNFNGTVDFGGGPLTSAGGNDIFLAQFDANCNHLWSKSFGDADLAQFATGIACDGLGNVIATGDFDGTVDFGGGPLTSAGEYDIFLAQFDANGNHLWSKRFGDASAQWGNSVACDGSGNVIVTGNFKGTVDLGGGPLTSAGVYDNDIFLAQFDVNGNHLWSKHFGDEDTQYGESVACDGSGNVIVTGSFYSTVDFGGRSLTSAGDEDIFVAKFRL